MLICANLADEIEAIWDKDKRPALTNDVDEAIIPPTASSH
jgi:hypothetical protein